MLMMNRHWIGDTTQSHQQAVADVKTDIDKQISIWSLFQKPIPALGRVPFGRNDYGNVNNEKVGNADLTDVKATAWPPLTSLVLYLLRRKKYEHEDEVKCE